MRVRYVLARGQGLLLWPLLLGAHLEHYPPNDCNRDQASRTHTNRAGGAGRNLPGCAIPVSGEQARPENGQTIPAAGSAGPAAGSQAPKAPPVKCPTDHELRDLIQRERRRRGWTLAELCRRAGTGQGSFGQYLQGQRHTITAARLLPILSALRIRFTAPQRRRSPHSLSKPA